jgi:hypothetical protein
MGDEQAHDHLVRDEDDHDLLTFSESAVRLRTEIARTEEALRESRDPERRAALEARLSALTDALGRNTRQAGASPGEKGFLDYAPPRRDGTEEGRLPGPDLGAADPHLQVQLNKVSIRRTTITNRDEARHERPGLAASWRCVSGVASGSRRRGGSSRH